jgi:tetratricopeptide (TPR) repeat protein
MGNECITKARDYNAAIRNFDKALKLCPDFIDAWIRKGVTLLDLKDNYAAQACFNEAVRLSPASFKARYNRGKCHILLAYYEEAVADLEKATTLKSEHASTHEYLAEAYRGLGEKELARHHLDIADKLRDKKR